MARSRRASFATWRRSRDVTTGSSGTSTRRREQRGALGRLKSLLGVERFYLAGGTALAFHLGHRRSLALDIFGASPVVDLNAIEEVARARFSDFELLGISDATLRFRTSGAPVDLVRYPYPLLDPTLPGPEGFPVAGLRDLATMKLSAIARRGLKRDFWDLEVILDAGMKIEDAAAAHVERFGVKEADLHHVMRALTFFDDADAEPILPSGLSARRWARIQERLRAEAPKLLARRP